MGSGRCLSGAQEAPPPPSPEDLLTTALARTFLQSLEYRPMFRLVYNILISHIITEFILSALREVVLILTSVAISLSWNHLSMGVSSYVYLDFGVSRLRSIAMHVLAWSTATFYIINLRCNLCIV